MREHVEALCAFGHRGSTTSNERRAAEYILGQLRALGISSELEEFRSHSSFSWVYAILYGGFALGGMLAGSYPFLGLLVLGGFALFFWGECTSTLKVVNRILPKHPSQNVLGKMPVEEAKRKLLLVAHHDSSKTGLSFHPRMVKSFRSSFLVSVAMILVLLEVSLIRVFGGGGLFLDLIRWAAVGYMLFGTLLMIHRELTGVYVQGAADNASGVAVVLGLAERFKREPLKNTELWILSTGCEEVNLSGMLAFMERHAGELDKTDTFFFNFDNLGKGDLHYIVGGGMLKVYPSSQGMICLAREVTSREEFRAVQPHVFRLATLDALVPSSRGYPALSMMALAEDHSIHNWHWHSDTIENMDFGVPQRAEEFAHEVIRLFDKTIFIHPHSLG